MLHKGRFVVKRITLETGKRTSFQYHKAKSEYVIAIGGALKVETVSPDERLWNTLRPGTVGMLIEPGTVHRMTALDRAVYIEASTPELDDVVRLEDDYGRV